MTVWPIAAGVGEGVGVGAMVVDWACTVAAKTNTESIKRELIRVAGIGVFYRNRDAASSHLDRKSRIRTGSSYQICLLGYQGFLGAKKLIPVRSEAGVICCGVNV